jgi:hypothetical protein
LMANKSVAYMLVAVLIGVTLITAVPDQIARYATPQQMLSVESGDGGSTVLSKSGEETVELYLDDTAAFDNESDVIIVTGSGFADSSVNSTEVTEEEIDFEVVDLNMFMWYAFDALIAVGVYFLSKRRFG